MVWSWVQGHWLGSKISDPMLLTLQINFEFYTYQIWANGRVGFRVQFPAMHKLYSFGVQDPMKSSFLNILPRKIHGIVYQTCTLHFMRHRQKRDQFFFGYDILISCETHLPNNLSTPAWSSSRVGFLGSIPGHVVLMAFSILLSDFT